MPRPVLVEERRTQILDAYETCVARHGLDGATLDRIAEEAGLARALIRHNVGNRDELRAALIERFLERTNDSVQKLVEILPDKNKGSALLDILFDSKVTDPRIVLVSTALIAAGTKDPELAEKMREWNRYFVAAICNILTAEYPKSDSATCMAVAAGITGIYFNVESMSPIGPVPDIAEPSKRAAEILLKALSA